MSSTLTCLPFAAQLLPGSRSGRVTTSAIQSSNITRAPNLKWEKIDGPVQETLFREMQKMYWEGVRRELLPILLTLRKWQQSEFAETTLVDEKDDFIHGFDTFVDQVSETSRGFADRYDERVRRWKKAEQIPWKHALADMGKDMDADWKSSNIKMSIRDNLGSKYRVTKAS
jgi:hypothetical protein